MKSFSPGLSDSIASVITNPAQCPHCDSSSRVGGGLCVGCLLQAGLDPDEECAPETLLSALSEITLPDKNWRLGNYEILEEIGRGGMGVIYRARQRHSRRIVAVKRVLGYHADSRETLARFRREAQAAASLDHPNILPMYEVSESEDGLPFFSMKFAPGGSLQEVGPALKNDPRRCVALVAKIARAVQHAHGKGILHRDLKPGNILMDAHGEPLVSDFGLAKWLDTTSDLTRTLTIFGTPGYIAPEQASGPAAQLKPVADVYSLGAILFDLLAGRPPFLGSHALSVIRQAAESPAPKLRSLSKIADRDLETICAHCLEREPSARYRSAHDLAEDLERWLEGRSIIARPVLPPVRLWRWSRRNPVLTGAVATCLLVASLAITRQLQGLRFQKQIAAQTAAQHSIEISPLLDLDAALSSYRSAEELGAELQKSLTIIGPAVVKTRSRVSTTTSASGSVAPVEHASARTLLSGTLRRVNGKLRLSLHLLEPTTQATLLHRMVELDPTAGAGTAAQQIADTAYQLLSVADLKSIVRRTSDPGLLDAEAKSFIEQGTELSYRRGGLDIDRGVACLERAIELQPESSAAYAGIAQALIFRAAYQSSREPLMAALDYARKAIALDSTNPAARLNLAAVLLQAGKISEATEEAFIALEYSPNTRRPANLMAHICRTIGRPDKALLWYHLGREPGRNVLGGHSAVGDCFAYLCEDERAETAYGRYLKLHPEQPEGWMGICRLRLLNGRIDEARAIYRREMTGYVDFAYATQMAAQVEFFARNFTEAEALYDRLHKRNPKGGANFYGHVSFASALGLIRAERDPKGGRELLEQARQEEAESAQGSEKYPYSAYGLAAVEAALGNRVEAIKQLGHAVEAGWIDYRSTLIDPRLDSIRDDVEFRRLIDVMQKKIEALRASTPSILRVLSEDQP